MQTTLSSRSSSESTPPIFRAATLFLIIGSYVFFIAGLWPGVLAEDSAAVLRYLDGTTPFSPGKTAFWMTFLECTYGFTKRIEVPIIILACLCVLVLCRIQLYLLNQRFYKSFFFCLFFISLAPHLIILNITLIGDGIFAVATAGLFFELYTSCKRGHITAFSLVIIILTTSFALMTRTNGLPALIPITFAAYHLCKKDKLVLAVIVGVNLLALSMLNKAQGENKPHSAIFPLVIWETINFLQPPVFKLPSSENRVSQKTIETLEELNPIDHYLKYYDREYWDPLNFDSDGPLVGRFTSQQKKILQREFIKRNLPNNLGAFMGSRTHVFFSREALQNQ